MTVDNKTNHHIEIVPLAASKLIERLGFYGIRAFLVLYMVRGPFMLSKEHVSSVYELMVFSISLAPLLGGLLGDLILGWKWTSVTGGFIQAAGCFLMAIPQPVCLYAGICCMVLGTGLYAPNIISVIGNLYQDRLQKMDAAMVLFYLVIDLGAFLGAIVFGYLVDITSFRTGFITAGVLMMCSPLLIMFTRSTTAKNTVIHNEPVVVNRTRKLKLAAVVCCIVLVPLFWIVMKVSPDAAIMISRGRNLEGYLYMGLIPLTAIICGIIFSIVWTFKTGSSLLRISIGFLLYAVSLSLIFIAGAADNLIVALILALLFQGAAETFVSPVALSYISQHVPSKFRSMLTSVFLTMSSLLSYSLAFAFTRGDDDSSGSWYLISMTAALVLTAAFLTFHFLLRKGEK
ncbi:MAG: putative Glucose-phosphate adenylyltransferase [Bacteroidetes bacterium]|nr:putative Glucose-phosphate adenylyltransferase [Bacteroidota bacterium]